MRMAPLWTVTAITTGWALCLSLSILVPNHFAKWGETGWDRLGTFLAWQMGALALAVLGLVYTVLMLGRLNGAGKIIGFLPTLVTLAVTAYIVVTEA